MKRSIIILLILQMGVLSLAFAKNLTIPPIVTAPEPSRTTYTAPYTQNFNGTWPPTDWYAPEVPVEIGNTGYFIPYCFEQRYSQACAIFAPGFASYMISLYSPQIYVPGPMYRL
jgi:hypothetical protein